MIHLALAWYLAVHKWYVLRAGLILGAPLWRLLIHDWTKCTPAEWSGAIIRLEVAWRRRSPCPEAVAAEQYHVTRNPHHWQYWHGAAMPDACIREMVADWIGAAHAKRNYDVLGWYAHHAPLMTLHPATRAAVARYLQRACDHRLIPSYVQEERHVITS